MNEIQRLEERISRKEKNINQMMDTLTYKKIELNKDLAKLSELKEAEEKKILDEAKENCYNRLNIDESIINHQSIVFDDEGTYVETISNKDYNSMDEVEDYLKSKKLYAHLACSFNGRSVDWYSKTLKEQLISLGWEVNSQGKFTDLSW